MKDNNFYRISADLKLRKSGPAFVPILHNGKALGVKFQSEDDYSFVMLDYSGRISVFQFHR